MNEIDLIPNDYRLHRQKLGWLRIIAAVAVLLGIAQVGGFGALKVLTNTMDVEVATLQQKKAISTQQRSELEALRGKKQELEQQLQLLTGLRSGAAAESMFFTVDRALQGENVWFLDWQFQRAGVVVEKKAQTKNAGYFVVIPSGQSKEDAEAWQIETHMTIRGLALNHVALSTFVSRLIDQPEISNVRVIKAALQPFQKTKVVDFSLAVTVNSETEKG